MSINFPAPSAKIQTPDRLSMSDPRASNRQRTFSRPKQSGMTLVEIMISLLIGAILLGGVLQIFLSTKQTYRMQEGLSRLQENARFAMEFLTNDIRMAGYFGCLSQVTSITNTLNNPTSYLINFAIPIQGSEWLTASSTWSPTVDTSIISPLPGSDVITIRSASPQGVTVTSHPAGNNDQGSGSADLKLSSNLDPGIQNCDILVVSDCMRIAIFQVTNFNSANNNNTVHNVGGACTNPGNATKALGKNFENGEVYRAQNISYYVRQNSAFVTGALNPPPPSLYRVMNSAAAEELVEGIEQIQITYGVDTDSDGSADRYLTANNVADWNNVGSVRINLLAISMDNFITSQPLPYTFNGNTITPNDRRLRRAFSSTIALRNRLR